MTACFLFFSGDADTYLWMIVVFAIFAVVYLTIRWLVNRAVNGLFRGVAKGIDRSHADEKIQNSPQPEPLIWRFEGIWEPPVSNYVPPSVVLGRNRQPAVQPQPAKPPQKTLNGRPLLQGAANRRHDSPDDAPDRYCYACGAELRAPYKFCMKCGKNQQ